MKNIENNKKIWVKPEVKNLSVKNETMSGSTSGVESNGHPTWTAKKKS